jgi:hypothetical protein
MSYVLILPNNQLEEDAQTQQHCATLRYLCMRADGHVASTAADCQLMAMGSAGLFFYLNNILKVEVA